MNFNLVRIVPICALLFMTNAWASVGEADGVVQATSKAKAVGSSASAQEDNLKTKRKAFLEANDGYLRANPESSIYGRTVWLTYLTRHQENALVNLYFILRGKKSLTPDHNVELNKCLFEFQNSFELHKGRFSREFMDTLAALEPVDACRLFNTMCGVLPRGILYQNWFCTLELFLTQLPEEERTLKSMQELAKLLHAEENDYNRFTLFNKWHTNYRLIALNKALESGTDVTMANLKQVVTASLSLTDVCWDTIPTAALISTSIASAVIIADWIW